MNNVIESKALNLTHTPMSTQFRTRKLEIQNAKDKTYPPNVAGITAFNM